MIAALKEQRRTLATAESCTGGGLGQRLTAVPGSSAVYLGGVISYCNAVKHRLLGVSEQALDTCGAVSACVAEQMAQGARDRLQADIGVGITGLAGPDGDGSGKPVGLVYIGVCDSTGVTAAEYRFSGDRAAVRAQACDAALKLLLARTVEA